MVAFQCWLDLKLPCVKEWFSFFFFLSTDFLATPLQRFSHFLQELNISNGKENSFKICLSFFLVENNLSLMWNLCTFHLC